MYCVYFSSLIILVELVTINLVTINSNLNFQYFSFSPRLCVSIALYMCKSPLFLLLSFFYCFYYVLFSSCCLPVVSRILFFLFALRIVRFLDRATRNFVSTP